MFKFIRRSFALQFVVPIGLFLAVVAGLAVYNDISARESEGVGALRSHAKLTAMLEAGSVAVPLWNVDKPGMESAIATLTADPDFVAATVLDDKGKPVVQKGTPPEAKTPGIIESVETIQNEKKDIGEFHLYLSTAPLRASLRSTTYTLIAGGFIAVVLVAAVVTLIARRMSRPVENLTRAMQSLAGGKLETDVPATGRLDQIGQMAHAVLVFKENAVRVREMTHEQEVQRQRAEVAERRAKNEMADEFDSSVKGIVRMVTAASAAMQTTAGAMTKTAEHTEQRATSVAAAAEQASANVQTVASTAEQLTASIQEISRRVSESSSIAASAVTEAARTNEMVQGLAVAATKISEVVKLITDIASQTNLLALNATIEAARAGDAGKGFAVVASEVKNLANQTARATDEIVGQISSVQDATRNAVEAIKGIGSTINRINEIAGAIASAVSEQGAATQEIARSVHQAAAGTQEVSAHIGEVQQAAGQTGSAASEVLTSSSELSEQSTLLGDAVDKFIARVRAA